MRNFCAASGGSRIFYFVLAGDSLPDAQAMRRLRHAIRQYLNLEAETSVRVVCENFIDMTASPVLRQTRRNRKQDNAGGRKERRSGEKSRLCIQPILSSRFPAVAWRSGFTSPAYFSRYFKRVCGCQFL